MRFNRREVIATLASTLALPSRAQAYPAKPVTWLVSYPPGGPADTMARAVGEVMAGRLGQAVIVDNRPGAGGQIAGSVLMKAPADGYTLMLGDTSTLCINKALYRTFGYDPATELKGVAPMLVMPMVLLAPRSSPYNSLADLVAASKKKPVNFASQGNGSTGHLLGEMLRNSAGGQFNHIPYKGSAPAMVDLLAGQVDMLFDGIGPALQHLNAGKLKVLAVAAPKRLPQVPDVPTTAELGYPGVALSIWFGAVVRDATPEPVVHRLHSEIAYALAQPKPMKMFGDLGFQPMNITPDQFTAFIRSEAEKWGAFVRSRHISVD